MKEYRYSITDSKNDIITEYAKTYKECKAKMFDSLHWLYTFSKDISIMIDTIDNNIITNTRILKGKEFIIS